MIWTFIILLALVILLPFLAEARRPVMDDAARVDAPGSFAELSQGVTHYRWHQDGKRGPVAVCVHGLTTPSFVWDRLAKELTDMNFRVLVYDLYGRGYSDRPKGPQTDEFFVQQLTDLLEHEEIGDDITLFGYSMGGVIATSFAAKNPDMIRQLVLVAPAGMGGFPSGWWRKMRDLPLIGDWLGRAVFPGRHRRAAAALAQADPNTAAAAAGQAEQLNWRGFIPAVLSSLRYALRDPREAEHKSLGRADVPVLAIWAAEDEAIPLSGMGALSRWNRLARQVQIEGATHWLPLTHPSELAKAIHDRLE